MFNLKEIKKIKRLGIEIDHDIAFGGKSKGNKHLFRVVAIAKFLALKMRADISIVEAGAWLHDTALPSGNDYDYVKNKQIITKLLSPIDLSASVKIKIAEAVASHEGTVIPKTLEAKIVHDADVLEKTGILGIIRHTWKLTNNGNINPELIGDQQIKEIVTHIKWRNSVLQTTLARDLAKKNNIRISINTLRKVVPIISKLAHKGVVTEKIALKISPFLDSKQNQILKDQLLLTYLK